MCVAKIRSSRRITNAYLFKCAIHTLKHRFNCSIYLIGCTMMFLCHSNGNSSSRSIGGGGSNEKYIKSTEHISLYNDISSTRNIVFSSNFYGFCFRWIWDAVNTGTATHMQFSMPKQLLPILLSVAQTISTLFIYYSRELKHFFFGCFDYRLSTADCRTLCLCTIFEIQLRENNLRATQT